MSDEKIGFKRKGPKNFRKRKAESDGEPSDKEEEAVIHKKSEQIQEIQEKQKLRLKPNGVNV